MSLIKQQIEKTDPRFAPQSEEKMSTADMSADADFSVLYELTIKEEQRILTEEGPYTVNGCFYPDERDAWLQRTWLARKRVREQLRQREIARRAL